LRVSSSDLQEGLVLAKGLLRLPFLIILFSLLFPPAYGGASGVWPLFSYHSAEVEKELEIGGPLFLWRADARGIEWGMRPFVYHTRHPSQELWRWELLYPLARYQVKEGDNKAYLVPFSLFRDEVTSTQPERREQASSFLTAFWGETDRGERYAGFFPLAGKLKKRFGRDEIAFYLWPFYSRIEDEGETTWRIPWPFFSLFGGEAEGAYIWPLWGHKVRAGEYEQGFVLWPFYAYMDQDLDTDYPVKKRYYLPLYATVRSPGARADLFTPFFLHQRVDNPPLERWEFPWPFLTVVKGEGVREWQVFPLVRLRDEEQKKRFYCLWPVYKYEWDLLGGDEETVRRLLLINRYRIVRELETGREALDANLWPLFDYRRGFEGERRLYIFPLLPLHDEGMERNVYPLLWVYRYTYSPEGVILSDLLWGLYRRRASAGFSSTQFAFLLRVEKKGEGYLFVSFLEGLISYHRTEEGGRVGFLFMGPSTIK
jgi:hypothetical protein